MLKRNFNLVPNKSPFTCVVYFAITAASGCEPDDGALPGWTM